MNEAINEEKTNERTQETTEGRKKVREDDQNNDSKQARQPTKSQKIGPEKLKSRPPHEEITTFLSCGLHVNYSGYTVGIKSQLSEKPSSGT